MNSARLVGIAARGVFAAALAWLASRVFVGLDFTDEMQYYGEIVSLTRTGRFFQDDLFIQQLGYVLLLPFFKVHALFFPDQRFLVVFGRLLLFATYAAVSLQLWRAGRRLGCDLAARLASIATFLAWVPFQIFAFGYNSLAYLLLVSLLVKWFTHPAGDLWRRDLPAALLIVALGVVYPPVGLALALGAIVATRLDADWPAVTRMLGLIGAGGIVLGGCMIALHGRNFFSDLALALQFSRAFGVAEVILLPTHLGGYGAIVVVTGVLIWRLRTAPGSDPRLVAVVAALGALLLLATAPRGAVGYFATAVFIGLLTLLRAASPAGHRPQIAALALAGVGVGSVFAFTSGNGLHNFGLGAMSAVPLLILHAAPALARPGRLGLAGLALPAIAAAVLVNGICHPYREQKPWHRFARVTNVPAFAGLWTSPVKLEALDTLQRFTDTNGLAGRRLLIAGPHAWIYFAARARPATSMVFLHYSGTPRVYEIVASRLFHTGLPDAVLITNDTPPAIYEQVKAWAQPGVTAQPLALPADFVRRYRRETDYDFAPQIILLRRPPAKP